MRLIAARLERVRQHRLLELDFGAGFTLIAGANETGKSTIVEALHKALFLKATASGRGVDELRSLTHGGLPEVELRFDAAGEQWLLRKRFAGSGGTCQLSSANGPTLQGSAAETHLAALLQVAAPVEGRRIAQLPLRWAHLWVRQGEAGVDPLAAGGEAYDLTQLVQQLQHSPAAMALSATAAALESPLDRLVQQQLQQLRDQQLTATGKVRAGSPLAAAQQHENDSRAALVQAEQRLAELEAAMEELRQIKARLAAIEQRERPALIIQGQRQRQVELLQQLQTIQRQQQALQQQRLADQRQRLSLEQQGAALQLRQQELNQSLGELQQRRSALEQQQQQLVQQQEVLAAQRDLAGLEREEAQLRSHKSQFDALQQQAGVIKQQLLELPQITPVQVRQLRQAEQRLAQAQARCEGMATRLTLLCADQPVQLDGQAWPVGSEQLLQEPLQLQIGSGTTIAISPGGGTAMGDARVQRQQAETQLAELQTQLGLADSEAADARAQQRLALEAELANLRTTAQAIPWARLDAQLAELEPRRQRLLAALRQLQAPALPAAELAALDASQDTLKAETTRLSQALAELERCRAELQQQLEQLGAQQAHGQAEAARLDGGLAAAAQQLSQLQAQHGDGAKLEQALQQCHADLETYSQRLAALQQQNGSAPGQGPPASTLLQQLEAEKDTLLSRRGQQEQLCRSLGSLDPVAAVEQAQASWEQAQAERQRLEQRTAALQRLLDAFHGAQQQAADQYCLPLQTALQGYLDALQLPSARAAQMGYDPQQGFGDLQLQQGNQSFDFEQLSGGMREQLAAALRLALAEVLLGAYDGCLPLVFDDAFSNSDPERRGGVLRMLQRGVSRGLQILMFSCTPDDFAALATAPGSRLQLGEAPSNTP